MWYITIIIFLILLVGDKTANFSSTTNLGPKLIYCQSAGSPCLSGLFHCDGIVKQMLKCFEGNYSHTPPYFILWWGCAWEKSERRDKLIYVSANIKASSFAFSFLQPFCCLAIGLVISEIPKCLFACWYTKYKLFHSLFRRTSWHTFSL